MERVLEGVFGPFEITQNHVGPAHRGIRRVVIRFQQNDSKIKVKRPFKIAFLFQRLGF